MHLIPKIRRNLEKIKDGYKFLTIKEVYFDVEESLLYSRINSLNSEDKEKIYNLFDKDLKSKHLIDLKKLDLLLTKKLDNKLRGIENKKQKPSKKENPTPIKPFYDIFSSYKKENETDEEFHKRINSCISKREMEFLVKKYGNDLTKSINDGNYTKEEDKYIIRCVIPVIKQRLKRVENNKVMERKTLLEKQPLFVTKEDLDYAISTLSEYEQELIKQHEENVLNKKTYYGEFDRVETYILKLAYAKIRRAIMDKKKSETQIQIKDLKKIKDFIKTEEYNKLLEKYSPLEALAIMTKVHISYISVQNISKLTGVPIEVIVKGATEYLLDIKNEIIEESSVKELK